MTLAEQLTADMKAAMKAKQTDRLTVIRMLINEVRNADLAGDRTEQQAVEAYAKKLRKGVEEFEKIDRPDEAQKLRDELAIVETYLPQKASPEQTERLVEQFIQENSFTAKQFGAAMGAFMKQHGSEVDASAASNLLRQKLPAEG